MLLIQIILPHELFSCFYIFSSYFIYTHGKEIFWNVRKESGLGCQFQGCWLWLDVGLREAGKGLDFGDGAGVGWGAGLVSASCSSQRHSSVEARSRGKRGMFPWCSLVPQAKPSGCSGPGAAPVLRVTPCVPRQECVEQLLRNMFDGEQSENCIVNGTQVLLTLLETRRSG